RCVDIIQAHGRHGHPGIKETVISSIHESMPFAVRRGRPPNQLTVLSTVQTACTIISKLLDCAHADIHRSTPFAVMFGRAPNQLADHSSVPTKPSTPGDIQARMQFMQEALFPGVADAVRSSQAAKKAVFDATHSLIDIPIDSHVMVRDTARRRKL